MVLGIEGKYFSPDATGQTSQTSQEDEQVYLMKYGPLYKEVQRLNKIADVFTPTWKNWLMHPEQLSVEYPEISGALQLFFAQARNVSGTTVHQDQLTDTVINLGSGPDGRWAKVWRSVLPNLPYVGVESQSKFRLYAEAEKNIRSDASMMKYVEADVTKFPLAQLRPCLVFASLLFANLSEADTDVVLAGIEKGLHPDGLVITWDFDPEVDTRIGPAYAHLHQLMQVTQDKTRRNRQAGLTMGEKMKATGLEHIGFIRKTYRIGGHEKSDRNFLEGILETFGSAGAFIASQTGKSEHEIKDLVSESLREGLRNPGEMSFYAHFGRASKK